MNSSKRNLIVLLLIYCLVRLPIILSIEEPFYADLDRGTIALAFLEGDQPLFSLAANPYGLGSLLAALWTIPFFALLGKTLFALKLAPFVWHIFSLFAWYFVWRKHFSVRETFFILLFFVLSPPHFTEYSLVNNGYHFEMILWMALSILIFRSFLQSKISVKKAAISLGLLGGFTCALIPTNVITVLTIWIYLIFWRGEGRTKKVFGFTYIPFFLIAFSPWIFLQIYNHGFGWEHVVYWYATPNTPIFFAKNLLKLFVVPGKGLQGLFRFSEIPPLYDNILMMSMTALFLFSFLILLKRKWPLWKIQNPTMDIETFGLVFMLLNMALVAAHRFGVDFNYYLFPMLPFIGMTLVRSFQSIRMKILVASVFIVGGVVGNLSLIHFKSMGSTLKQPGYHEKN